MQKFHLGLMFIQIFFHAIFVYFIKYYSIWLSYSDEVASRYGSSLFYDPTILRVAFTFVNPLCFMAAVGFQKMNVFAYPGLDICWFFATIPYDWPYSVMGCRVFVTSILFFAGKYVSYTDFMEGSVTSFFKGLRRTNLKVPKKDLVLAAEELNVLVEVRNVPVGDQNSIKMNKLRILLAKHVKELTKQHPLVSNKTLTKQATEALDLSKTINFEDPV
jgi:hypothetical protein